MNPWDQRYSAGEFYYGTDPNDFLRAHVSEIRPGGRVLCLAEGEGRNAVYLAGLGYDVVGVDGSPVGLAKMIELAQSKGVNVTPIVSDLADFEIQEETWDGIVSIWCHLPEPLRRLVHRRCVSGLKKGGVFILEAYRPKQLEYKTGGPSTAELLMTLPALRAKLDGLTIVHGEELDREIHEGRGHFGKSAVVQVVARKP